MNKQGCSLTIRQATLQEIFSSWTDEKVRQLVVSLAEMALQLQMQAHLHAQWNQRSPTRCGYRNGYYRRQLTTPHGVLALKVPRCREGSFDATVTLERYHRRIEDVERILRHAYLLGAGTRGLAQLAQQLFGGVLSHQTISRLMRWLDGQLVLWRNEPIESVYPVVYIDGMHVDMVGSDRNVMLVAGMRQDGTLEVLGFCVSKGERCVELLEDLRRRGLEAVRLFVSDDSGAIRSALEQVYPDVDWQYCAFHRLSRLRMDIGATDYRDPMVAEAACVFRCPSREAAWDVAAAWRALEVLSEGRLMDGMSKFTVLVCGQSCRDLPTNASPVGRNG